MSFPRYPEYKDTDVEWLGKVPAHWAVKRLRYVVSINPSKSEVRSVLADTEVSFIPMEAVGEDGSLDLEQTRRLDDVIGGYTYVRDGDVTFAKITPCFENGKAALMIGLKSGIGFGTTELTVLRPDLAQTTSDYLFRVIHSEPFRALGESFMYGAGGQKRVPDDFARDFQIAWPPREEQRTIAAFLDFETARIDALIAEQQRLIELLKEKRQAVISHAVTKGLDPDVPMKDSGVEWLGEVPAHWDIAPLKHIVATPITDGPHETPVFRDEGVPFVSAEAVSKGVLDFTKAKCISREDHEKYSRKYIPQRNDIFMVKSGATTGVTAIVETNREFNIWSPLAVIRCGPLANPSYVLWAMRSKSFLESVELHWSFGTQQNIGMGVVENLPIPLPPIGEQEEISQFIREQDRNWDDLISESKKSVELLEERRSALISAAVTGKIDVRGWRAESHDAEAGLPKVAEQGADYSAKEA